jgi:hypothetical protein
MAIGEGVSLSAKNRLSGSGWSLLRFVLGTVEHRLSFEPAGSG